MTQHLSKRAEGIKASGIRAIFDRGRKLADAVDLSIGQPHYDIPEEIKRAAIKAIEDGCGKYTVTQGEEALRRETLELLHGRYGIPADEPIMLTSGTAGGLHLALLCLVDPGDRVLCPDPYFVIYKSLIAIAGGVPAYYSTYPHWRVTRESLEKAYAPGDRVLLVNTPQNPTGRVLSEEELRVAADFARERDMIILSDEIYDRFTYGGRKHISLRSMHENTLTFSGFGKTYGMPGWRLSWATGPEPIIDKMRAMQQMTFVCPPAVSQKAGYAALRMDMSRYVEAYEHKASMIAEGLGGVYDFVAPQGAFYMFCTAPGAQGGLEFMERAIERNLLVVPGRAFSTRDTHFRISFAVDDDTLERGIAILRELAE